jgi:hypothetical protein
MSNSKVPGMLYPTQQAGLGSTPAQSSMIYANNQAQMQANANRLMAGGKRKWFGGANIAVPQFHMLYRHQGGPESNPNNLIAGNSITSTQSVSNATNDKYVNQMGGFSQKRGFSRRHKSRRNSRRTFKSRKSRKSRKSKKR